MPTKRGKKHKNSSAKCQKKVKKDEEHKNSSAKCQKKVKKDEEGGLEVSPLESLSGTLSSETESNPDESVESSEESEDIERDEERAIREEAAALGYSGPLADAYISNDVKQLEKVWPMRLFIDLSLKSPDVRSYAYCLVDSHSYKLCEKEDFRAFIKSIRYIGKGYGNRCCQHPFEEPRKKIKKRTECEDIWKKGGKLTAVCLISSCPFILEAHMLEAFGKVHLWTGEYCTLWNLIMGTYQDNESVEVQQNWGVQLLYMAWKVYVDKPVIAEMIISYSHVEAMREETEQKILKEAEAFGYSETLTGAFKSNYMFVEHLKKAFPMEKIYSPTKLSGSVKYYAYCLVDSTSYKSSGKEDFEAFIRSVRYIGKGTGCKCFTEPLDPDNSEKIWKEGGKWTAVCLSYFSSEHATEIKVLLLAALGKEHLVSRFPYSQLLNNKQLYYRDNKTPSLKERKKQESWGVQLLYTAWKVYVDKPVIFEMMLSHPKTDAEAMRASDKRLKLRTAAQECFTAAHECFTAADAQYQAAFDRNEHVVKRYNEASKTFEEKKESLKKADDKIKGMEIAASKQQVKPKQKQQLQAAMEEAAESKEQAERDVTSAGLHKNATEIKKKKAETYIEEAEKVMAALRIQPGSPT